MRDDFEPWHLPHMGDRANDAAECCTHNCNQGRNCPRRIMKPSHMQTPRTLNECTFTPGYVSSDFHEDRLTTLGHMAVTICGLAIIVVIAAVEIVGWLS
jgi:hypothetical protein